MSKSVETKRLYKHHVIKKINKKYHIIGYPEKVFDSWNICKTFIDDLSDCKTIEDIRLLYKV